MNVEKLLQSIEKKNQERKEEINRNLADRIKYGAKETLDYFQKKQVGGYTSKEILKDLEKSKYK